MNLALIRSKSSEFPQATLIKCRYRAGFHLTAECGDTVPLSKYQNELLIFLNPSLPSKVNTTYKVFRPFFPAL